MIIFFGFENDPLSMINARSTFCVTLNDTKRPIAGYVIFNVAKLTITEQKLEFNLNIMVHEMMHLIGVHKDLYKTFPLNSKGQTVLEETSEGQMFYRGDEFVKVSREHFNCENLEKIPLEDNGTTAVKGNHLEARIFGNEIMTPSARDGYRLSKFSLAILKDSGW